MRTETLVLHDGRIVEIEIDESERVNSSRDVLFEAWGADVNRLEGLPATLHALLPPGSRSCVKFKSAEHEHLNGDALPFNEVIARARQVDPDTVTIISLKTPVPWQLSDTGATPGATDGALRFLGKCDGPRALSFVAWDILGAKVPLAVLTGPRSVEIDAAVTVLATQEDMEDLLVRLCAPKHIVAGTAVNGDHTAVAPIERCATYHADAATVARDLALSWIFLYETSFVEHLAALPLAELAAHVENAPAGARVGVGTKWRQLIEYPGLDARGRPEPRPPWDPADQARKGPRVRLPGEAELTREEVLAALATPPANLLEALDACTVPDAEWNAAEPIAREILKATKAGAPSEDVRVSSDEHTRWIEQHAPSHVRRLPNGAVMLATHPYRVLWDLWADALHLLDIR
jgi:hypothetical protein